MRSYQFKMYDTNDPKKTKYTHVEIGGEQSLREILDQFQAFLQSCDFAFEIDETLEVNKNIDC